MPFTGAHPFAILPFTRIRWLDPTCLAIGSMGPDLEYFARGHMTGSKFGHTWPGVALWCVPIAIAVALLYHQVVKGPLWQIAPRWVARRTRDTRWPPDPTSPRTWIALIVSAALGATTHLVWDAFTHPDGFVVRRVPGLAVDVAGVPVHRVLQIGCSLVGLAGIAFVLVRRWMRAAPVEPPAIDRTRPRAIFAICIPIATALVMWHAWAIGATRPGDLMVAPVSGVLAGILAASVLVRAT